MREATPHLLYFVASIYREGDWARGECIGVWVWEVGADVVFAETCSAEIDVGKGDPN